MEKPCGALEAPAARHGRNVARHGRQCHLLLIGCQLDDAEIQTRKGHEDLAPHAKVAGSEMRALRRFRQAEGNGYEFLVRHGGDNITLRSHAVMETRMACDETAPQGSGPFIELNLRA